MPVPPEPEGSSQVITPGAEGAPVETDPAIVATPNDIAPAPYQLNEAEVAEPGFNGGGRR